MKIITKLTTFVSAAIFCICPLEGSDVKAWHHSTGHHHVASHHRHHHHHKGTARRIASVAAPIGIGAAFGPAGSIGYQGFKHRRAIKHHLIARHRG